MTWGLTQPWPEIKGLVFLYLANSCFSFLGSALPHLLRNAN